MLRLRLVRLVCCLIAAFETIVGAHAAALNGCDCENQIHLGAGLSCCGGKAYNPATATCCKEEHGPNVAAVVTEDLSEMVSACCGLIAYSPLNEICCNSTVVTKSTASAQCCGRVAYDEHEQLCCGRNRTVQRRESRDHQCCEHKQFNTKSQCCCLANGSLEIHEKDHECCIKESAVCGKKAYNKHTELCCQLTVVTKRSPNAQCCGKVAYDEHEQLCCGRNRTVQRRESRDHQCCEHKQFNTKSQCCCLANGSLEIHEKDHECCIKESAVCGKKAYNKHTELCCQLTVVTKRSPNAQCCGKVAYDEHEQLCCGRNRTIQRRESRDHQCCEHKQFNTKSQCCCLANGSLKIHEKDHECCIKESAVCGKKAYNKHTELCCQLTVVTKRSPNAQCCGKEAYDEHEQLCCGRNRTVQRRESRDHQCCEHKQFNTKSQCCCFANGSLEIHEKDHECCIKESGVQPLAPGPQPTCTDPETSTCGSSCYNPKESRCCEKKQSNRCYTTGQCDAAVYNPETDVCCDGHVRTLRQDQQHGSPGHCCGTEVYWPFAEICCDGHRHRREKNVHCCGAQAYHITNAHMKCCAGTLYNLTLEHGVRCCGSILQKQQDVCCSHEDKNVPSSSPVHQPGHRQTKTIEEERLQSLNNLSEQELCKELKVGTVESVSLLSTVFSSILKVHGEKGVVEVLPSPQILETSDHSNSPTLIPGKTYFFNGSNIFTDPNHDSILQSIHFIFCKCGNR